MGMGDIRNDDRWLAFALARIRGEPVPRKSNPESMFSEPVPEPNRSKLLSFYRHLVAEELCPGRITVLMGNMHHVSIWLRHRPFEELTKDDVIDLVEKIKHIRVKRLANRTVQEGYAEQTIESYKIAIKKFWKWLKPQESPDAYPPEVSWIRRRKGKNGLLPKDLWTPEEVSKLAGLAFHPRDRAFVLGLFGSGCRIGEFLPLQRRDVVFDAHSAQVLVDGKTGSRRVRLTPAATVAMAAWLDVHPNKSPDAPVWVDTQVRSEIPKECLSYAWAHKLLGSLAARAGITKHIRPHLLRHSLATYYAARLTEAVMNEHFGWRQGGRTAAIYTHLSGRQVDDQILSMFGRKRIDLESSRALDVVFCPRCGLENTTASAYCGKCGFPLNDEAALELVERRKRADALMDALVQRPEFAEMLRKTVESMGVNPAVPVEGFRPAVGGDVRQNPLGLQASSPLGAHPAPPRWQEPSSPTQAPCPGPRPLELPSLSEKRLLPSRGNNEPCV